MGGLGVEMTRASSCSSLLARRSPARERAGRLGSGIPGYAQAGRGAQGGSARAGGGGRPLGWAPTMLPSRGVAPRQQSQRPCAPVPTAPTPAAAGGPGAPPNKGSLPGPGRGSPRLGPPLPQLRGFERKQSGGAGSVAEPGRRTPPVGLGTGRGLGGGTRGRPADEFAPALPLTHPQTSLCPGSPLGSHPAARSQGRAGSARPPLTPHPSSSQSGGNRDSPGWCWRVRGPAAAPRAWCTPRGCRPRASVRDRARVS